MKPALGAARPLRPRRSLAPRTSPALALALLLLASCEAKNASVENRVESEPQQPAEPDEPEPATEPVTEATTPSAPIVGIDSAVTTSGLPHHLRFALHNSADTPLELQLERLTLRAPNQAPQVVTARELQLWPAGADQPSQTLTEVTTPLPLPPNSEAELLIYLDSWEGNPRAERYDFEAHFRLAGDPLEAPVTIRRARREPLRR